MGFAVWIDREQGIVWAQGTHEYRPMGTAAVSVTSQFRRADFSPRRRRPRALQSAFAGFFASIEEVNQRLKSGPPLRRRTTPAHLL